MDVHALYSFLSSHKLGGMVLGGLGAALLSVQRPDKRFVEVSEGVKL